MAKDNGVRITNKDGELVVTLEIILGPEHLWHCNSGLYKFCQQTGIPVRRFKEGVPLRELRELDHIYAQLACDYVEDLHNGRKQ